MLRLEKSCAANNNSAPFVRSIVKAPPIHTIHDMYHKDCVSFSAVLVFFSHTFGMDSSSINKLAWHKGGTLNNIVYVYARGCVYFSPIYSIA